MLLKKPVWRKLSVRLEAELSAGQQRVTDAPVQATYVTSVWLKTLVRWVALLYAVSAT